MIAIISVSICLEEEVTIARSCAIGSAWISSCNGGELLRDPTVPLAPRVFQLVGTIYAAWYAATRLVKSDERKKVSSKLQDLWNSIRGGRKG